MCYYKDAEMHILVCEVKIMSVQEVLDIIRSFFEAIIAVFSALMGGKKEEGATEPQA